MDMDNLMDAFYALSIECKWEKNAEGVICVMCDVKSKMGHF